MDIGLVLTVVVVVQIAIFGFGLAEYDIKIVNVEVPWSESRQGCMDMGYDILNLAVVSKTELVSQGVLKDGEYYWTSQYQSRSPFYWKLGCYGVTDRSTLNETDFGSENSVYRCSQKCGNLRYLGLENTTCFCFPASAKLSQESKTPCTTVCPGNSEEICGESGSSKMTVYRKLDEVEDRLTLQDTTGDCVTLNKEDVDQLYDGDYYDEHKLFTNQICTEKKTFFCRNYKYNPMDINSEIFIYKSENKTWYEAQRYCISNGNDMAYIDGSNALGVLSRDLIPEGSESWIGLFRATAELSIIKDDVAGSPASCHSVTINGNVLEESYNICIHKLKTICMKELPTTEARTSEMSSTDTITTEEHTTTIPTTEILTTETPTTEVSTIEVPTTETPSTEVPTTEMPTTEVPTTEMPTTEVPTTEMPTTEVPTTEMPTTEVTTTEMPTTEVTTTETLTTETLLIVSTEEATETTSIIQTTNASKAASSGSGDFHFGTSPISTEVTTELLQPHVANVAQKNVGEKDDDDGIGIKNSGLLFILIALLVILIISVILVAMAYKRYRRNRSYQRVSLMIVRPYPKSNNGTVANYSQTPPSPVKTPTPKKPARTSIKQDNVLLNISQGNFVSQSDQFEPGTRDDVSWNLPFIDASRETLDNIDETQPVIVRRTILLSENEANSLNIGHPNASVDLDDKVSHSHSEEEAHASESEPILNADEDDDDIFDDNVESRLPRSPSEHIDLLFRMSLSGEKD